MSQSWQETLKNAESHLAAQDPVFKSLIPRHGACRIQPHSDHYGALVDAIIGQQLSEKAGATILRRFKTLFDETMPEPSLLITMDTERIRQVGVSYAKVAYMKDLAQHCIDGRLDLVHIATLPNDVVVQQLTAVKGIGEWTAHMFLIFSLGRLDILPTGDLGVRKAMMKQYKLTQMPSPIEMKQIATANNWHPYESVAAWYLWQSLDNQ